MYNYQNKPVPKQVYYPIKVELFSFSRYILIAFTLENIVLLRESDYDAYYVLILIQIYCFTHVILFKRDYNRTQRTSIKELTDNHSQSQSRYTYSQLRVFIHPDLHVHRMCKEM